MPPRFLREDVSLDELCIAHAKAMYKWACDPTVADNIGLTDEPSLEKTIKWIETRREDPSTRALAILLQGVHVGNVVLDRIDPHLRSSRLSIYIGKRTVRGQGVGRTAIWLALKLAFLELGLHKVWLTVHSENYRALNLYLRLGFVIEGVHRDEFLLRGRRLAVFYLGMLRPEFLARAST